MLKQDGMTTLAALALLAFLGVVACTLCILSPRREWLCAERKDVPGGLAGAESYGDVAAMQRFLAEHLEED